MAAILPVCIGVAVLKYRLYEIDRIVSRYDAEVVVAAFTARLRGTVELDAVQRDLISSVYDPFEPAHVAVWLSARE